MAGMNTASNPGSPALDSFLEKWRTRWPEWQVAEVFVPASQRELAVAWFALIQEFEDVMNASGDTTPADAKLAWWGEELRDWSRRRSRHPLGRLLEPHAASWFALAEQLPVLQRLRERPGDAQAVLDAVQPLAGRLADVEAVLFGGTSAVAATDIATQLLAARLFAGGGGVVPSGHGEASWAAALLQRWPRKPAGGKPRRIWSALARTRLGRLQPGASGIRPPSLPRILWLSWKAAR